MKNRTQIQDEDYEQHLKIVLHWLVERISAVVECDQGGYCVPPIRRQYEVFGRELQCF